MDGADYGIDEVRRCDPLEQAGLERELELQGRGSHAGEAVQIDVYVQSIAGTPMDDVSWAGPEGVLGSAQGAAVEAADGRVTGTAVLTGALDQGESVSVEFGLPVPDELLDCHV